MFSDLLNSKAIVFQSLANRVAESNSVTAFSNAINSDNDQVRSSDFDEVAAVEPFAEVKGDLSLTINWDGEDFEEGSKGVEGGGGRIGLGSTIGIVI